MVYVIYLHLFTRAASVGGKIFPDYSVQVKVPRLRPYLITWFTFNPSTDK